MQRQVAARLARQLDHDRNLALRQVQLGEALVVVAGGGDAQRVGDGGRGHAEVGGAREVGPHHQLGAHQARGAGDVADAGNGAQLALDHRGVLGSASPFSPASTRMYFSAAPPRPTVMRVPGMRGEALAQLALDRLLARCRRARGAASC